MNLDHSTRSSIILSEGYTISMHFVVAYSLPLPITRKNPNTAAPCLRFITRRALYASRTAPCWANAHHISIDNGLEISSRFFRQWSRDFCQPQQLRSCSRRHIIYIFCSSAQIVSMPVRISDFKFAISECRRRRSSWGTNPMHSPNSQTCRSCKREQIAFFASFFVPTLSFVGPTGLLYTVPSEHTPLLKTQ